MSGVPIHTHSPITAAKATAITPQTSYPPPSSTSSSEATTTVTSTAPIYSPAQPGSAVAKPTATKALSTSYGPPLPQPGAVPTASATQIAPQSSLPPPPKAGDKIKPSEYYVPSQPTHATPVQPQPYPSQMMLPAQHHSDGQHSGSTKSTTVGPQFPLLRSPPSTQNPQLNPGGESVSSLEHPPGYAQNPYASDMTPDQRFATEQANQSGGSMALGYTDAGVNNRAGFQDDESVWGMAKKWAKGASDTVGDYVTDMNEKISRNLNNEK